MLDQLRNKPKPVREKYAFWGAIATTAVIALVWGLSLSAKFNNLDSNNVETAEAEKQESGGAFSRSFSDAKSGMASAWEAFTTSKDNLVVEEEVKAEATEEAVLPKVNNATNTDDTSLTHSSSSKNIRTIMIATTSVIMASSTE
jgi:hypothetical protein